MGRKIPAKKHHGVKDPDKQRAVRLNRIKNKINAPPTNSDDQAIPKSLQRIIDFKEKLKNGDICLKRKRKKASNRTPRTSNASEPIGVKGNAMSKSNRPKEGTPNFVQHKDESDQSFLNRVQQTVHTVINEVKFEKKFSVTVKRNVRSGEIEGVERRSKDEIDELMKKAKKNKRKKKTDTNTEPRLTKSQKKHKKLVEKKTQKALNKGIDFDHFKDKVEFGDIVHRPPSLTAPRRVNKDDCAPRPGRKDLLLKSVLKSNVPFAATNRKTHIRQMSKSGNIDKTGKRKDLPNAVRMQLESHRNEVVDAYRIIKESRIKRTE